MTPTWSTPPTVSFVHCAFSYRCIDDFIDGVYWCIDDFSNCYACQSVYQCIDDFFNGVDMRVLYGAIRYSSLRRWAG